METRVSLPFCRVRAEVYSEVEPFEGWKLKFVVTYSPHEEVSIARLNPLRDGNGIQRSQLRFVFDCL